MPPDLAPANTYPVLPLLSQESESVQLKMLADLSAALPNERIDLIDNFTTQQLAEVEVAIAANPTPAMFEQLPKLQWVQSMWAGVENMLEDAVLNQYQLVRLIDPKLTEAMAEAALTWTLYLHRRIPEYALLQRNRRWQQLDYKEANECRVSILGLGELGKRCATRLADNGFKVSGWSRNAKTLAGITCYAGSDGLAQMLKTTDILILLLPLTAATRALVNQQTLALLPSKSSLINFSRGAVVDTNDLLQALDQGQLDHAVLDVFDTEPLPATSPLWHHERITVLPHVSALTDSASAANIAARHISTYRVTGALPSTVDLVQGY